MIDGTIVPDSTGTTTSTGQIMMTVNLTSPEQVESLTSNSSQVLVVAPPDACGAPSIPAGSVVAAHLQVSDPPANDDTSAAEVSNIIPELKHDDVSAKVGDLFSCILITGLFLGGGSK